MKEIGGYFGLEESCGNKEYYPNLIALNTARNALVYVLKVRKVSKIYIPYFLCDTVYKVCEREGFAYEYYHVDQLFRPLFDKHLNYDEYLYIVNYYGQIQNNELLKYKEKFGNIIVDNVQAFFQEPIKGIDTIYSCRKFVGVPDGAYLSCDEKLDDLEVDNSNNRTNHIYGRVKDGASAHYQEFKDNDESLYDLQLMLMSDLTHKMLKNIDYELVKEKRENNFKYLAKVLNKFNRLDIKDVVGPYAYPFYIERGTELRKQLIKNNIFVATLWPNVDQGHEGKMAQNILPIPCDQRYNTEDMKAICDEILRFVSGN